MVVTDEASLLNHAGTGFTVDFRLEIAPCIVIRFLLSLYATNLKFSGLTVRAVDVG